MATSEEKRQLRNKFLNLRKSVPPDESLMTSNLIAESCIALVDWKQTKSIHIYLPIPEHNEISTWPLLKWIWEHYPSMTVAVPITKHGRPHTTRMTKKTKLTKGPFGVPEPAEPSLMPDRYQFDVIFVPVLAFDRRGYRLGYGKGYYDQFLAGQTGITIGLAYSTSEVFSSLPVEGHDVALRNIVTEKEVIRS